MHVNLISSVPGKLAESVSRVVRAAYCAGDLVPGLPTADGARVHTGELLDDLAAGQLLWVAELSGRVVGTVRAVRSSPQVWEVRRLAVSPSCRRTGAARRLLRQLEAEALARGVSRVALDAVVERGNPAFYARVGYRTVRHFPAGDKPLSEVRMERDPRAEPTPVAHDAAPAGPGLLLDWRTAPGGTVCRPRLLSGDEVPAAGTVSSLGADFWPSAGAAQLPLVHDTLVREGGATGDGEVFFDRPASQVAAFRTPRQAHPELLAWWRSPIARHQTAVGR
ncbi:GNAT family N-acetyltransferase [Streptomyces sp. Marseille-Q5077]|uniref:GNAT family N-acetyltransferase n=1 Tax=Streptomyces sp. Marseille-Q5077 TaxID=3418995 RepID=UPI003D05C9C3